MVKMCATLDRLFSVASPRFGLMQDESLWVESEEADVLSVELDLTESTDGTDSLGGCNLGLATTPAEAELLHSGRQHQTRVTLIKHRIFFISLLLLF